MKILTYIKSHAVLSTGIAIVAVVAAIIGGRVASRGNVEATNTSNTKKVSLVEVSNFADNLSKVSADGVVESVSQVDIRSQISSPIASVNVAVGNSVAKGQTITTLQNADIRAQLDQARANLQLAQGQYQTSGISFGSSKKGALDTLRSSYNTSDEIVNGQLSQFLFSDSSGSTRLSSFIPTTKLNTTIRESYLNAKYSLTGLKDTLDKLSDSSSNTDIGKAFTALEKNTSDIATLLNYVSNIITDATSQNPSTSVLTTLNTWQSIVAAARASINASSKNLTTSEAAFSNSQVSSGSSADAALSAAQAGVKNLEAQLAKTIFTSPIDGKIAFLPLRVGELAQPGQLIASVVGGGGLQIKVYASGEDLNKIKTGAKALVNGTIPATVTAVAPSVNSVNKKAEINVSVDPSHKELIIGQNVSVSIESNVADTSSTTAKYLLPIQDVKIVPGAAFVYTLDTNSKIVKNPIIISQIQGGFVNVESGLTPDMKIVTPVYELNEGESVIVQ